MNDWGRIVKGQRTVQSRFTYVENFVLRSSCSQDEEMTMTADEVRRKYVATLVTANQAAQLAGVGTCQIGRWAIQGKITPVYEGPHSERGPVIRLFDPRDVLGVPVATTGRPRGAKSRVA